MMIIKEYIIILYFYHVLSINNTFRCRIFLHGFAILGFHTETKDQSFIDQP